MHTPVAIYTENLDNHFDEIMKLFHKYSYVGDVVIITDNINSNKYQHQSLFPSFYIKFFRGIVIFLEMADYLEYYNTIIGSPMLFIDHETFKAIDKSLIKHEHILSKESL